MQRFFAEARHPDRGVPLSAQRYLPMLELLDELRRRQFSIFVVTGGGTEFVRAIGDELRAHLRPNTRAIVVNTRSGRLKSSNATVPIRSIVPGGVVKKTMVLTIMMPAVITGNPAASGILRDESLDFAIMPSPWMECGTAQASIWEGS